MPCPPPTARLDFREMTPADLDVMATLLGDPVVMWVYPHPYSREDVLDWIEKTVALYRTRGFGLWLLTLRETGEFVGECGLVPQVVEGRDEVEVGYHIRPEFWGRGLATEAVTACRDFARDVAGLAPPRRPHRPPERGVAARGYQGRPGLRARSAAAGQAAAGLRHGALRHGRWRRSARR